MACRVWASLQLFRKKSLTIHTRLECSTVANGRLLQARRLPLILKGASEGLKTTSQAISSLTPAWVHTGQPLPHVNLAMNKPRGEERKTPDSLEST